MNVGFRRSNYITSFDYRRTLIQYNDSQNDEFHIGNPVVGVLVYHRQILLLRVRGEV